APPRRGRRAHGRQDRRSARGRLQVHAPRLTRPPSSHQKADPMPLPFSPQEIVETIRMVQMEKLDIRTITLGVSLRDCADTDLDAAGKKAYDKICRLTGRLVAVGDEIEREYGIPIVNKRISVTPVSIVAECASADRYVRFAEHLDRAAAQVGVNFLGGFSALVHKGATPGDRALIASIPEALATTERVCASMNVGT